MNGLEVFMIKLWENIFNCKKEKKEVVSCPELARNRDYQIKKSRK